MADDLTLAAEFAPATREDWLKLVRAALKGQPYENLVMRTYDGLAIAPLHAHAAQAQSIVARRGPWQVLSRIDHPDPVAANAEAKHELENGANGLTLVFQGAIGDYGFGLAATEAALARVLDGVYLDAGIAIDLNLSSQTKDAGKMLAAVVKRRGIAPEATNIRFGFDPLGAMAAVGGTPLAWRDIVPIFEGGIGELAGQGFRGPFAPADGRVIYAAGGAEAQELGFVLAVAVAYLRALKAGGIALDAARRMIYFRLAADADQLLTIAKFRALRKLWARVEDACGLEPQPAFIAAETGWRMMTRRDPWMNMLRTTIAAFSAGLGGADAITMLPFTAALGLPDRFARRIARNTLLLLLEESNLARVADPAAGSGGLEDLSTQLCHAAWSLFQEIEAAGGVAEALAAGLIQQKVAKVRTERETAVARRVDALTGTSDFPDLAEAPVKVLDVKPVAAAPYPTTTTFAPLLRMRLAEPYERLREASDRMLAATGARPKVFLANLGALADFNARATFSKNFFEAGGIEAVQTFPSPLAGEGGEASAASRAGRGVTANRKNTIHPAPSAIADALHRRSSSRRRPEAAFPSPARGEVKERARGEPKTDIAALITAFKASGAKLACMCSSDEVYAHEAAEAAKALAAAGARHIYLAGRPREHEAALKAAGVGTFIFSGCDGVATLKGAHDILGIETKS
jgi:methylmalonyl-CoA mutase